MGIPLFITLVTTLITFMQTKGAKRDIEGLKQFFEENGFDELKNLISENTELTEELDYFLAQDHQMILGELQSINETLAVLASQSQGLHGLARILCPEQTLSDEAKTLVVETSNDRNGYIMKVRSTSGLCIQTNGNNLIEDDTARTAAIWEGAVDELLQWGLLKEKGHKGQAFSLTREGFDYADVLKRQVH